MSDRPQLEHFLEDPQKLNFYDSIFGGLSDNLMTIGTFASGFLSCAACGDTFTLHHSSWQCQHCAQQFSVKFKKPSNSRKASDAKKLELTATVEGLEKPGAGTPHWYYSDENWTVAGFLSQLLRLPAEQVLPLWLRELGIPVAEAAPLSTLLSWPRLQFGSRTIQPDLAAAFEDLLVFFEFKRPDGGNVPSAEIAGQMAFAEYVTQQTGQDWLLVIVPGGDRHARKPPVAYVTEAFAALDIATAKWSTPPEILTCLQSRDRLSQKITVVGWERWVRAAQSILGAKFPPGWSRDRALAGLDYFLEQRVQLGLLERS